MSAVINGAISLGFFLAVFGGSGAVTIPGFGNYAFDFLPQSFVIGIMATLVPGLLAREAIANGRFPDVALAAPPAGAVLRRTLVNSLIGLTVGAAFALLVLFVAETGAISYAAALLIKIAFGALLGAVTTRLTLRRLLEVR